ALGPHPYFGRTPMSQTAPSPRPLVILVVDDLPDCAESMAMLLRHYGHTTLIANNGADALRLAQEHAPDVAFMDLGLPGMDGYEIARRFRGTLTKQPFIAALTGYGDDRDRELSRQEGFDRHFLKPLDPLILMDYIQECVTKLQ